MKPFFFILLLSIPLLFHSIVIETPSAFDFTEFIPNRKTSADFDIMFEQVSTQYVVLSIIPSNPLDKYKLVFAASKDDAKEYSDNLIAEAPFDIGTRQILLTRYHLQLKTANQTTTPLFYCFLKGPENAILQGLLEVQYYDEIPLELNKDIQYVTFDSYHMDYTFRYTRKRDSFDYLNLYALGGADDQVVMKVTYDDGSGEGIEIKAKDKAFYNGDVIEFEESDYEFVEGAYFKIEIHSHPGVPVRVGIHDMKIVDTLIANKPASYAYFNTTKFPNKSKCYLLNMNETDIHDNNEYSVTVVTRSLNTFVFMSNSNFEDVVNDPKRINEHSVSEVTEFTFTTALAKEYPFLCFSISNSGPNIAYSVQLLNITSIYEVSLVTEPLISGLTYMYTLKPNESQIFTRAKFNTNIRSTTVNFRSQEGELDAYIVEANNYPDMKLSYNTWKNNEQVTDIKFHKLTDINGFSTYKIGEPSGTHILHHNQTVAVATCAETSLIDCIFEISFADKYDYLYIEPNIRYTQVQSQNQVDQFTFRLNDVSIKRVVIELSTYSGDSNMEVIKTIPIPGNITSYYIGNKEVVEITKEYTQGKLTDINGVYQIMITATTNNIYTLGYFLFRDDDSDEVVIDGGMQVLEYIELNSTKKFTMKNLYHFLKVPWISTFTPVNCDINVTFIHGRNKTDLHFGTDEFLQHYIGPNEDALNSWNFTYKIKATTRHNQEYSKLDRCLIYIIGFPLTNRTELVVNEAVPFKLNLDNDKPTVHLFYPRSSGSGNVLAYVNVESDTPMYTHFAIHGQSSLEHSFTRSKQIQISSELLEICDSYKDGQICPIVITVSGKDKEGLDPMKEEIQIEFAIKTENAVPIYLQKNKLQEEFSFVKSYQYFVTDVSRNEHGEIYVNYLRGSGRPYMKIVPKEISEDNADWNGKVVLPKKTSIDLDGEYDPYTRILRYTTENTHKCVNGCDMYIGVLSDELFSTDVISFSDEFSIYIRSFPSNEIVDIPINEYIYGAISSSEQKHYYTFNLPIETDKIYIELQCETCEMYIEKGYKKPTSTRKEDSFKSRGKDTLHEMKLNKKDTTRKTQYTIMLKVTGMDAYYTQLYNFRIRVHKENAVELIDVSSDQSALCKVSEPNGYCDFIIPGKESEMLKSILLYAYGQNPTDLIFYIKTIESEEFDFYNEEQKREILPRDNSTDPSVFSSKDNFNPNLISIPEIQKFNKNILVSIKSSKPTLITLLSTFRTYLKQMTPNPSTILLYEINEHSIEKEIHLTIPSNNDYIVHVVCIDGTGVVGLVGEELSKHVLTGRHDSLTFNVMKNDNKTFYIRNDHPHNNALRVYFWYHVTSHLNHFDEIQFGQTGEVYYTGYDFPIDNFVKVEKAEDIVVNLDLFKMNSTNISSSQVDVFDVQGYFVDQKFILEKRKDLHKLPHDKSMIKGIFDPTTKKGSIIFEKEKIKLDNEEQGYLLIHMNKKNNFSYIPVHYEISVLPTSGIEIEVPVNYYQTAMLGNSLMNYHMLRKTTENDKTLIFELATNSPKVQFAFSTQQFNMNSGDSYSNSTDILLDEFYQCGKHVLSFNVSNYKELYIVLFSKNKLSHNEGRYIFKYGHDMEVFKYEMNPITLNQTSTYNGSLPGYLSVSVNAIKHANDVNIVKCVYHLKIYRFSKKESGDNFDSINTPKTPMYIAKTIESENETIIFDVMLEYNDNYNITIDATVIESNELLSFQSTYFKVDSPDKDPEQQNADDKNVLKMIVIVIVVIIAFVLIIAVVIALKVRNKGFGGNVTTISGVESQTGLIPEFRHDDESL